MEGAVPDFDDQTLSDLSIDQLDCLRIQRHEVHCVVGVYPHERRASQPVEVNLDLYLDARQAGADAALSQTVDYARVCGDVTALLSASRFGLIESAAEAVARLLLAPPPPDAPHKTPSAVRVEIAKTTALPNQTSAALSILRSARDLDVESKSLGVVQEARFFSIPSFSMGRFTFSSRASHTLQVEADEVVAIMASSGGLSLNEDALRAGTVHFSRKEKHLIIHNPTAAERSLWVFRRQLPEAEREALMHRAPLSVYSNAARQLAEGDGEADQDLARSWGSKS
jgi:dihydroneopterin aldolase